MKKLLIIFLLVAFISYSIQPKIAYGGIGGTLSAILGVIRSINDVLSLINNTLNKSDKLLKSLATGEGGSSAIQVYQLQEQNQLLSSILETRFEEEANKVFTDSLKEEKYQEYANNIIKFVEERKKMANDPRTIQEMYQEAEKAGAYNAITSLPDYISCINPEIRESFREYLVNFSAKYNLSTKANEIIDTIPDCSTPKTSESLLIAQKPSLKLNLFAWLFEPFKFNLAQVSNQENAETEIPSITITPAFQETENTIELNDLQILTTNLTLSKINDQKEEIKNMIGDAFPVIRCIENTVDFDGGEYVCTKYQVLISDKELKDLEQSITSINPSSQTTQDINIYRKLSNPRNVLQKIGLNRWNFGVGSNLKSLNLESDQLSGSITKEDIKKIIDETCTKYAGKGTIESTEEAGELETKISESAQNNTLAYALCVKEFNEKLKTYFEIKQKDIEEKSNYAQEVQRDIDSLRSRAKDLSENLKDCPAASRDLSEIIEMLGGTLVLYGGLISKLNGFKSEIRDSLSKIAMTSYDIRDTTNKIFKTPLNVLKILNKLIRGAGGLVGAIGNLLGIDFDEILAFIKGVANTTQEIEEDLQEVYDNITGIIRSFNGIVGEVADTILDLFKFDYELYSFDFSLSDILNDSYKLELISEKLDAYERLIAKGGCTQKISPQTSGPERILVESKKPEIKSTNFLALIKSLFQPKIVEIRNER